MSKNRSSRFIPLIITLSIIAGIAVGSFYARHFNDNRLSIIKSSSNKLNDLLHIIDDQYVDKVEINDLVEQALPQILKELDPHSVYLSTQLMESEMERLKGSFSGVGILFTILNDTINVIRVVEGGPSEAVGIQPGDRIIEIDGESVVNKDITNEQTQGKLKGPKNTKVNLTVMRPGLREQIHYTVIRGDIPVKSVDAAYMLDENTGYLRINTFGDTTYPELLVALARLNYAGFKQLIVDLRGDGGGYMAPAVRMVNEFLPKNRLIVYTEGRKSPRQEFRSDGRGSYQTIPLIVLVDESSASSSEIFTAAIQDNDRGTIIGRRTFGKGLVQEAVQFSDGSMLRLTVARYYSPSGRCLQKPYVKGDDPNYQMDLITRAEKGEYYSEDSIHLKGNSFKTSIGRTVYDGGGVMPDYFIPADTIGITSYFQEALYHGHIARFAYAYLDKHREKFKSMKDWQEAVSYLRKQRLPDQLAAYGADHGLKRRNLLLQKSYDLFTDFIISSILNDFYGDEVQSMYINQTDPCVLKAKEIFAEGKAFPERTPADATPQDSVTATAR